MSPSPSTVVRRPAARRALLTAALLASVVWTVPAFAQGSDINSMMNRLSRLENDVQTLNQQVYRGSGGAPSSGAGGGGGLSGSVAADFEVRLTQLEATLRELKGQQEQTTYAVQQLRDRLEKITSDYDFRFQQMEAQVRAGTDPGMAAAPATPASTPAGKGNGAASATAKTDQAAAQTAKPAPSAKPAEAPADKPAGGQLPGDAAQQDYDRAFALLRDADYPKAEQALAGFVSKYPRHDLAGNAQYWLGETYYVRGKYSEAAVAFAEGFQKYPKSAKAADNLLKLAMSLGQLKQTKDACLALSTLNAQFAAAPATVKRRAEQESSKLGCK